MGGLPACFQEPKSASTMKNHIKKSYVNESFQKQGVWTKFTLLVKPPASVIDMIPQTLYKCIIVIKLQESLACAKYAWTLPAQTAAGMTPC